MRTFRFHPKFPEGKIFDTEGREAPFPPSPSLGWVEHRGELKMTEMEMGSQMVENAVRAELAQQEKEGRDKLDKEHVEKYGFAPPARATSEQVANIMDNKTADGRQTRPTLHLPKKTSKHFTRKEDR